MLRMFFGFCEYMVLRTVAMGLHELPHEAVKYDPVNTGYPGDPRCIGSACRTYSGPKSMTQETEYTDAYLKGGVLPESRCGCKEGSHRNYLVWGAGY